MTRGLVNGHDVAAAVGAGADLVHPHGGGGGFWRKTNGTLFSRWLDVEAAHPGVDAWVVLVGRYADGCWLPARYTEAVQALRWDSGKPVRVKGPGRPCEVLVHQGFTIPPCGRLATGEAPDMGGIKPQCNVHLAAHRRREANDAARRAEWEARDQEHARQRELSAASAEWARRLRDELGLDAHGARCRDGHLRVEVEPERLYGQLLDVLGLLRDAGLEDAHPFHPGD